MRGITFLNQRLNFDLAAKVTLIAKTYVFGNEQMNSIAFQTYIGGNEQVNSIVFW